MTAVVAPLSRSEKLHFREVFTSAWASGLLPGYIRTYVFVRFSSPHSHREMCPPGLNLVSIHGSISRLESFVMRKEYLDKVEDNASVCAWSEKTQLEKGDSVTEGLRDLLLAHPDVKKRVDVLALSIYGLVIFPKAMGHIDEAVADLFDRLGKQNTHVPAILAETFRSLSECQRAGEGRFIGCAQLLLVWFHNHFWKVDKVPCRVFFEDYSTLKEAPATSRRDDITEERSFDWVPLLGIWGVVGYAPLLVLRKIRELKKKIEKLEEEKIYLSLDVDVQKIEAEKVRKEKRKIEEDRDDLKTQYKRIQLSIKRVGLGKSSEQWQQEVQEERAKAEYWEKKFKEM
ncbi:hypothetical protein PVK06_012188 [Gossypium arboreum]|uniref:DUF7745 domain-containing protein n=1 Tax=Gossypium arboreum TaxID=29729 RepID=A0ABR0QAT6_GOSAR|nr:hypothetical protein PVK06_012188 [Gossypium arboreum]